jgi:glucan 1,3-beta-glucosidase
MDFLYNDGRNPGGAREDRIVNQVNRREFLRTTTTLGAAWLAAAGEVALPAEEPRTPKKLHGVNLGGWLVLEKWIKPSLFAALDAKDEYTFCEVLGKRKASELLTRHRETWIIGDDFRWLATHGVNAVRLPVGYWVAEENPPFLTGLETMDWAFRTAKANGISVLLDLHGVPGSQNGWDHSGRQGELGWHNKKENIAHSLQVIEDLAAHCQQHDNLLGIELVNEPRKEIPLDILKNYYLEGYHRIRHRLGQERTAVVIHDSFRPLEWAHFLSGPDFQNVILDVHLYQCFNEEERQREAAKHIAIAAVDRRRQLDEMKKQLPLIVGEWSLGLPPESLRGLDRLARDAAMRAFGAAQLLSYESTRGWFFWTYRTEAGGGWSFRDCVKRGWLPEKLEA